MFEVLDIDMVEALIPSLKTASFKLDYFFTKSTPESGLAVLSDAPLPALAAHITCVPDVVVPFEMGLERISAIKDFGALSDLTFDIGLMAAPDL